MERKKKLFLLVVLAMFLILPVGANENKTINISRHAGDNRYETSINTAKHAYKKTDYAVIASGENFPDALTAGPLAMALDGPIILSPSKSIQPQTLQALVDLEVKKVFIIGSEGSISKSVKKNIESVASVERIGGKNRYETSALVADRVRSLTGNSGFVLVSGEDFPDALTASSYFGIQGTPILLSSSKLVPDVVKSYIEKNPSSNFYVLGGEKTIPSTTLDGLGTYQRIAGSNRYETAVKLAQFSKNKSEKVVLVSGLGYPDALSASVLSKVYQAPLLLSDSDNLPVAVKNYISENQSHDITIVGGTGSVKASVVSQLLDIVIYEEPSSKPNFSKDSFNQEYAKELGKLINEERISQGKEALPWSNDLEEGAKTRAKEVSKNLTGTRPNESHWSTVNVNAKYESRTVINLTPENMIKVLTGGVANSLFISRSDFEAMGIGTYTDNQGVTYWVIHYGLME